MVLGNKCDINDKRQVSKDRGEKVRVWLNLEKENIWYIWIIVFADDSWRKRVDNVHPFSYSLH